jgi:nucleoside-diphosphate-sugar epimerase
MMLIFGHTGLIGKVLHQQAQIKGFDVIGASSKEVNLCDPFAVKRFFEFLHSAYSVVVCAVRNKKFCNDALCLSENVAMVRNIIQFGHNKIKSLIYLSSVDVYGRNPALPITEKTKIEPQSLYALSKLAAEYTLFFELESFPITIFRLPGIYGREDGDRSIIGRFYKQNIEIGEITIFSNVLRDYVYVDDLCDLIFENMMSPCQGIFNVATGESLLLEHIARLIIKASHTRSKIIFIPEKASETETGDLKYDTAFLREHYPNWKPGTIKKIFPFLFE